MSMQQIRYRVAVFIATVAIAVMASGMAVASSRGQTQSGGGQAGSNTTQQKSVEAENDDQVQSRIHQNAKQIGKFAEVISTISVAAEIVYVREERPRR